MSVVKSDIVIVMSGGSANADPNLCLGGDPSATPISGYLNNLFDNESEDDSHNGKTDYRCFYIFNDNTTDIFYNVKIWIYSQVEGGASIKLGIPMISDTQVVTITGSPDGGTLTLTHGSDQFVFSGDASNTTMASNFKDALSNLPECSGVTVTPNGIGTNGTGGTAYTVSFLPGRHHPTLGLQNNSLTGTGTIGVNIVKSLDGGPINQIASPVSSSVTPPTGITFTTPTSENPVVLGNLLPLDGLPVWVQRNCQAGSVGVPNDGAVIRITGKPFFSS